MDDKSASINSVDETVNLKEFFYRLKGLFNYLKSKLGILVSCFITGLVLGIASFYLQPVDYTSQTTFIVEEVKNNSSLGGIASLAGQFGVDVGSAANMGGSGVIAGDNILYYLKSENLIREVLLSPYISNSKLTFADVYAEKSGLFAKWVKDDNIGNIQFKNLGLKSITQQRLRDSLLQVIITDHILPNEIDISKVDKKASFIKLKVKMKDELLTNAFNEKLIEIAINNYISLKTLRQQKTVEKLQKRADSLQNLLSTKTITAALLQKENSTMDVNPLFKTGNTIKNEINTRDKSMITTVYAEVIKNLELAKFSLSQETPVIQIVDKSYFPLIKNEYSLLLLMLISTSAILLISIIFLITIFFLKSPSF